MRRSNAPACCSVLYNPPTRYPFFFFPYNRLTFPVPIPAAFPMAHEHCRRRLTKMLRIGRPRAPSSRRLLSEKSQRPCINGEPLFSPLNTGVMVPMK